MCALVGYEAFHSKKRWVVTLLTFILASASFVSIIIYVDSFSLKQWDIQTNTGPATLVVSGQRVNEYADQIAAIPGIIDAAPLTGAYARVSSMYKNLIFKADFFVVNLQQQFIDEFPSIFVLSEGRYPQTQSEIALDFRVADTLNVGVGDLINYSHTMIAQPAELQVVGVFSHPVNNTAFAWYYTRALGVVLPSLLENSESQTGYVYAKVKQDLVIPSDARGSIARLTEIDEQIRKLDIMYKGPGDTSRFVVLDFLLEGLVKYSGFVYNMRVSELLRSSGDALLVIIAGYIAVGYNINDRKVETDMLIARGSSQSHVIRLRLVEILGLSILSIPVGIILGILMSRLALSAAGFFVFNLEDLWTSGFVLSIDAIITGIIAGLLIPLLSFAAHTVIFTTRATVRASTGRLAKLSKGLSLLKWDFFVLMLGIILLITSFQAQDVLNQYPFLAAVFQLLPYVIFVAFASLVTKGLRKTGQAISKPFAVLVGRIPAWVGIRRISKEASIAGPCVMVLVLAMSFAWNSAIVAASLPATSLNQSHLAISGDLTFQLDPSKRTSWSALESYISNSTLTQNSTVVSVLPMHLSTSTAETSNVMAVQPSQFVQVAYDVQGAQLNGSEMGSWISSLNSLETGAIISGDIATDYSLKAGDILRTYLYNGSAIVTFEFEIVGVADSICDTQLSIGEYAPGEMQSSSYQIGMNRILVNQKAIEAYIENSKDAAYFLCVRTESPDVSSRLLNETLQHANTNAILSDRYVSAMNELKEYVSQDAYVMDRGVDTMLTLLAVVTVAGTLTIYASEGLQARRREIALLRAMGAPDALVVKSQSAELMVLALSSVALLGLYAPILIVSSLLSSARIYGSSPFEYPIQWYLVIPWPMLLVVLAFFLVCFTLFILAIAVLGSRMNLSDTLNSSWTEGVFYGGEE
jgi:ABC-type lipoprotein release transport system permease subunit